VFAEQTRQENMAAFFQAELHAIQESVKAIERRARVAAAMRDAESAEARAGMGGATGAQAARQGIAIDFQSRAGSIEAAIQRAEDLAAAAEERASTARLAAAEMAMREGEMEDVTIRARQQAAAAEQAAADARADAEAAAEIGAAQMRELFANFTSRFSEAADTAAEEAAASASQVIAAVEQSGTTLTAFQQQALSNLRSIVADGQVAQDETRTLNEAMQTIISGWQGDTKTLISIMNAGNEITRTLATELNALRADQDRLRAQVQQLQAR
jgi:polyhydroxyalkanoate synthesis regulator phasin